MIDSEKILRRRILLVDDQPEVRTSIRMLLDLDEHTVVEASSGAEALERFGAESFDLVITDYAMPGLRGDELAKRIKQQSPAQTVLLITGSAGVSVATVGPVDAVLYKPFMLEDLRRSIANLLHGN